MSQAIRNLSLGIKTYCCHTGPCFSASFKQMNICDSFLLLITLLPQDVFVLLPEERRLEEDTVTPADELSFSIREFFKCLFEYQMEQER